MITRNVANARQLPSEMGADFCSGVPVDDPTNFVFHRSITVLLISLYLVRRPEGEQKMNGR
jgi:hypothetical protein